MNTHHKNALVAILARIDRQIIESDALLLKLPTGGELLRVKAGEWGTSQWDIHTDVVIPKDDLLFTGPPYHGLLGFGLLRRPTSILVVIPYWAVVFLAGTFATAPWTGRLKWRFTLRTLLIAMTLFALLLGLIVVYATR